MMRYANCRYERLPLIQSYLSCEHSAPVPKGFLWLCRVLRNRAAVVLKQPLFVVPEGQSYLEISTQHYYISPNEKYAIISDYLALSKPDVYTATTLLLSSGDSTPKELDIPGILYGIFSPDSKLFAGFLTESGDKREEGAFYLVDCPTRKVQRLFDPLHSREEEHCSYSWGWYPDSRHIWFRCWMHEPDERKTRIYKYDVLRRQRQLLRGREREAIFYEWELRDPRYRSSGLVDLSEKWDLLAYARNHSVRVRVKNALEEANSSAEVFVEWRDGRRLRLLGKGEHRWLQIRPLDITDDGRWILLKCLDGRKSEKGYVEEWVLVEYQVWDAVAKRSYVYFRDRYGLGWEPQFARDATGAVIFGSAS